MKKVHNKFNGWLSLIVYIVTLMFIVMVNADPVCAREHKRDLILTVLYDNNSSNEELKTGWGYSCLISGAEKTILFDVGDRLVIENMDSLKINPESVDVVVISHEHYDHIGGLPAFSKRNLRAPILRVPKDSVEVCENVFTTGAMVTSFREKNPFIQATLENALILKTAKGLVVITGCAHPGIVEIVRRAKSMFPKYSVYLVMGGFHLLNESQNSVKSVAREMQKENVHKVAPSHCTGTTAEKVFEEAFGENFIAVGVGKPIIIEGAFQ